MAGAPSPLGPSRFEAAACRTAPDAFHLGLLMSVYDGDTAARLRKPVLAQFDMLHTK